MPLIVVMLLREGLFNMGGGGGGVGLQEKKAPFMHAERNPNPPTVYWNSNFWTNFQSNDTSYERKKT